MPNGWIGSAFRGVRYKPNLVMHSNDSRVAPTFPELYDELVGVFTDLKVLVFAMHHQYDMPEQDLGELAFTGDRIIDRFETAVEKTSIIATLQPIDPQQMP